MIFGQTHIQKKSRKAGSLILKVNGPSPNPPGSYGQPGRKHLFLSTTSLKRSLKMMWLLILSLLFLCNVVQPFPVFTFNGTSSISTATSSYAYLVNNLDLPDKFVLCTSVKQARFDDVGFYVISGREGTLKSG